MSEEIVLETTLAKRTTFSAGKLGKGTPGSRTKNKWKSLDRPGSLKEFARKYRDSHPTEITGIDAAQWLSSKRPGGSVEFRKMRKEVRSKRQAMRHMSSSTTVPTKGKGK